MNISLKVNHFSPEKKSLKKRETFSNLLVYSCGNNAHFVVTSIYNTKTILR